MLISKGIQLWRKIGTRLILPYFLTLFSDACLKSSRNDAGLDAIEEALDLAGKTGEQCWQSELYRLRGEHRLMQYSNGASTDGSILVDIEADYKLALTDANTRNAKSLELRSACSLAHFLRLQGRNGEAEDLLSSHCLQWDDDVVSADLNEAQSLLKSL